MGVAPLTPPIWKVKCKIESSDLIIVNLREKKYGRVVSEDNPRQATTAPVASYHNIQSAQNEVLTLSLKYWTYDKK